MSSGHRAGTLWPVAYWRLATAASSPGCHPEKGRSSVRKNRALKA